MKRQYKLSHQTSLQRCHPLENADMLQTLSRQQKYIIIQWMPSHVGIRGNETIDHLGKKGSRMSC